MALDIDHWEHAAETLLHSGVNIAELYEAPDAVIVDSGKAGHGKLLYAMPFGLALPSKKITQNGVTIYELRCATTNGLTVQDVLPPSIHPETHQPYRWAGKGHWSRLPTIPQPLLDLWQSLLQSDQQRVLPSGDAIDASWEDIKSALEHIDPNGSRDDWVNVGMALQWAGSHTDASDYALSIWNDWSTQSPKYPGEREMLTQWNSFNPNKATSVKLGTLFHLAKQGGWVRTTPDAASFFSPVEGVTKAVMEPAQMSNQLRPPPPDLDINLFPAVLATRAMEISESVGCDPLVPLFAGLGAVCGAIDARTRLELMPGFLVPPVLWIMTLGDPADKKSPGSRPMFSVLREIENNDKQRYGKELLDWEVKEAQYTVAKKAMIEFVQSPEAMMGNTAIPEVATLPPQPVSLKITVQDITSQKLVRQAADRPRGLLCYLDEMTSWVGKLVDARSGEDRSAWVVSYESEMYKMDRVGGGEIHCDNLAVSIYGNMQPKVFRDNITGLSKDGLLQRFIPVVLDGTKTKLGNPIPDTLSSRGQYDQMIRVTYGLPAMTYQLSPEAFTEYREFQRWYESAKQDERLLQSSDTFMTSFGKLEGLAGRVALVWHVMDHPYDLQVSGATMRRVVRFIKEFMIQTLRYSFGGELGGASSFDQWMTDYIIQHCDKPSLSLSDIKAGARRQMGSVNTWGASEMIFASMSTLVDAGWVARMDDGSKEHQHQALWAINPSLMVSFRAHRTKVIALKQVRLTETYKLSSRNKDHGEHRAYGFTGEL